MDDYMSFLLLSKGLLFEVSLAIFIFGVILRLGEVLFLGYKKDLSVAKGNPTMFGIKTIFSRSIPSVEMFEKRGFLILNGIVFHIGLFVVVFLFAPHITVFDGLIGISWPSISSQVINFVSVITIFSMVVVLFHRIKHKVMKYLTTTGDYIAWIVTFLPMLTGFMAYNHILLPYNLILALHILSVDLLLVFLPFSKLSHSFLFFLARFHNGRMAGQRGVSL
jgi:nitrate reductase gamma subunit